MPLDSSVVLFESIFGAERPQAGFTGRGTWIGYAKRMQRQGNIGPRGAPAPLSAPRSAGACQAGAPGL